MDYQKALKYPLNPCPLSVCHADGMKRSNKKSDLKEILLETVNDLSSQEIKSIRRDAVVVDMMGLVDLITSIPDTYEELAQMFVERLPKGYKRLDIVSDSYKSVKLYKNGIDGKQNFDSIAQIQNSP